MSTDDFDFDEFLEDDDHLMGWEQDARGAAEQVIDEFEFDNSRGVVIVDDQEFGADDFDTLVSRIAEAYDEQWFANVPFEGGEAVFDSDSLDYAENRLQQLGFFSFFEAVEQRNVGKLVLVVAEKRDSGLLVPRDTVIELRDFGLFTSDQIAELQDLIASPHARESDLQQFFERHPHFLSRWNHQTSMRICDLTVPMERL